ncbi:MAG: hypothetical protein LBT08_00455 [Synergistaceae bacterium]|nr:hypothetical protein [Synergistaceae bacterium]
MKSAATKDPIFREVEETETRYWNTPEARYLQFLEKIADQITKKRSKTPFFSKL